MFGSPNILLLQLKTTHIFIKFCRLNGSIHDIMISCQVFIISGYNRKRFLFMQGLSSLPALLWLQLQMERFKIFLLTGMMLYFIFQLLQLLQFLQLLTSFCPISSHIFKTLNTISTTSVCCDHTIKTICVVFTQYAVSYHVSKMLTFSFHTNLLKTKIRDLFSLIYKCLNTAY